MKPVHFWTRRPEGLEPWNPDIDLQRHVNGYGHAFLELHWRLRTMGRPVTIGPVVHVDASCVVVSLEEIAEWQPQIPARLAAHLALALLRLPRMPAVAFIRDDIALSVHAPHYTTLEVMPTKASIEEERQLWLPLLPQRGLMPRDANRGSVLSTVALKAYSYNLPSWLDDRFRDRLAQAGYVLRVDDEVSGRWPDFRDVDIALCSHQEETLGDERRKPATKLVNAWSAGVIPVCGDYVGYRELGIDGQTILLAPPTGEGLWEALRRLREQPGLAEQIRGSSPQDGYSAQAIVERYWRAFQNAPSASRSLVAGGGIRALVAEARRRAGSLLASHRREE